MRIKKKQPRCELPWGLLHEHILCINVISIRQRFSGGTYEGKYFTRGMAGQAPPDAQCREAKAVPLGEGVFPLSRAGAAWQKEQAVLTTRPAISAVAAFPRSTSQLSTLELIREPYAPFLHIIKERV